MAAVDAGMSGDEAEDASPPEKSRPPQHYLKMRIALQVRDKESVPMIEAAMPRILDGFQTFLRELRPEDLEGSQGMLNLREELIRRLALATQEPVVKDVLFREIIVQ